MTVLLQDEALCNLWWSIEGMAEPRYGSRVLRDSIVSPARTYKEEPPLEEAGGARRRGTYMAVR